MKCVYCGSSAYGKPCIFSPTNNHLHADEAGKCIYCGSKAIGSGCIFNPYSRIHIRAGAAFIQMKEQLTKSAVLTQLFERLSQIPTQKYTSPLDRMYQRLAGTIQNAVEPLLESFSLLETPIIENLDTEQKELVAELTQRLQEQLSDVRKTLRHGNLALPTEIVEKILLQSVLNSCIDK